MYLGIDVGTISAKLVCVDGGGGVVASKGPAPHEGRPARALVSLLKQLPLAEVRGATATGAGRKWVSTALGIPAVNGLRALSRAFARSYPQVRTIIEIGGRDSKLIVMREMRPGEEPVAVDASRSSMCAAGTGSFLDQQAMRLGFAPEELGRIAMKSEKPANVSGRCSVFAKTDLIHLQQIGTRDYDMLAGLCYAVVRNFRSSVAKGRKIEHPVAVCGGVALNECVRRALREVFELREEELILPEMPLFMSALGCAFLAAEAGDGEEADFTAEALRRLEEHAREAATARRLPSLGRPSHPASGERMVHPLPDGERARVYLGVDIGSISTKAAVITRDGKVVARRYFWTAGRPIEAVRRAMKEIGAEIAGRVEVAGVGTTGSGRYLVGDFIGADVIKNEITAQATAAIAFDASVDTVFEIGGQDSKFIVIRDGTVVDFAMNKVCAAGTGSFLEEQAERMAIEIEDQFSELAFSSKEPVDCGERCTVFMETDVSNYLASGASVEDLSGGLAHSVAKNYLSKVADRAKIGKRALFQGAVAFNDAVVAAFEKETGQAVRVTPDNEISGCIGAAMIARDGRTEKSRFRGFKEIAERDYEQSVFTCSGCENRCDVRKVVIQGRPPLFYGDRCDRYQTERRKESNLPDLFEERTRWLLGEDAAEPESGPVVGIPRALAFLDMMPFWRTFLRELGARTIVSGPTTHALIERSSDYVTTEACLPVKAGHGHVLDLIDKRPDFVFLPMLVDRPRPKTERVIRYNCPFAQIWGYVARAGIDPREHGIEVLAPVVFNALGKRIKKEQLLEVARRLGAPDRALKRALAAAQEAQDDFARRLRERGNEILSDLPGGRAVVLAGRPYNACDPGMSLDLPKKLRKMDVLPIPMDMLPLEEVDVLSRWSNMYWYYGRLILAASKLVAEDDRLDMIYVTNFRCGPDSFLVKYVPKEMKGKPYLVLEFDDHSADAGVVTRVEAYLDSRRSRAKSAYIEPPQVKIDLVRPRAVYLPHMGDMMYGAAAACHAFDIDARVIPTDRESLEHAQAFTSGRECLPFILCVGNVVKTVRSPDFDPENSGFFMASSSGSCRFGQYELGMRLVLDELGLREMPIYSLNQSSEVFRQLPGYRFIKHATWGVTAVNELERLARQYRPYEEEPGSTDKAYQRSLEEICDALRKRKKPVEALRQAAKRFLSVKTAPLDKPLVLVVGESYVRMQPFANSNIARKIEGFGGEAWVPTFLEWIHHVLLCMKIFGRENGLIRQRLGTALLAWLVKRIGKGVGRALGPAFKDPYLPHVERLWENATRAEFAPFFGDASLAVGLAIEMAERGADGVVNVMPFTCIPGAVARSQLRRAAHLLGGVPVLDVEFDGRGEDLLRDELEMFMDQVKERHRFRRAPTG